MKKIKKGDRWKKPNILSLYENENLKRGGQKKNHVPMRKWKKSKSGMDGKKTPSYPCMSTWWQLMTWYDDLTILFEHVTFFFTWQLFSVWQLFFNLTTFFHPAAVAPLPLIQSLQSPSSSCSTPPHPVTLLPLIQLLRAPPHPVALLLLIQSLHSPYYSPSAPLALVVSLPLPKWGTDKNEVKNPSHPSTKLKNWRTQKGDGQLNPRKKPHLIPK
jgi:hypothetical protein